MYGLSCVILKKNNQKWLISINSIWCISLKSYFKYKIKIFPIIIKFILVLMYLLN